MQADIYLFHLTYRGTGRTLAYYYYYYYYYYWEDDNDGAIEEDEGDANIVTTTE